jgi:hypothetical protein
MKIIALSSAGLPRGIGEAKRLATTHVYGDPAFWRMILAFAVRLPCVCSVASACSLYLGAQATPNASSRFAQCMPKKHACGKL